MYKRKMLELNKRCVYRKRCIYGASQAVALFRLMLILTMGLSLVACSDSNPERSNVVLSDAGVANNSVGTVGTDGSGSNESGGVGEPAAMTGENSTASFTGSIPADICVAEQPIAGVISIEDLVNIGVISSSPARFDTNSIGGFTICNVLQISPTTSEQNVTFSLFYNEDEDNLQSARDQIDDTNAAFESNGFSSRVEFIERTINGFDVLVQGSASVAGDMRIVQDNGLVSSLEILWNPSFVGFVDDTPSRQEAIVSVFELVATRASFEQRELPAATDWFACDDNNMGAIGASPSALLGILGADTTDISVRFQNTLAGGRQCTATVDTGPTGTDFRARLTVEDFASFFDGFGTTPVEDYLANDIDNEGRVADTLGGQAVGVAVRDLGLGPFGEVRAGPDNLTVTIEVRVPEEFEPQLGDLVRQVATEILMQIP